MILKKETRFNFIFSIAALLFLWLVWIVAAFAVRNEYILPSFPETFVAAGRLLADAAFWRAFGNTLLRTLAAFLVSLVLGVGLAVLASLNRCVSAFFAPIVSVLRTVPTMAVILMLLLWTTPRVAPVVVTLLVLFPAVYAAALSAIGEVKEEYGELTRAFRVPLRRKIFKMYLPLSAPSLLKQSGSILSMGLKITVSGEVLANTFRSMGGLMQEAKMFLNMPSLMALTLMCVLLGFALEGLCFLACKLLVRWRT